ncbi:MAG: HD domain-containing phosphohydrolase [Candidatus Firestonebacteria bacterium]
MLLRDFLIPRSVLLCFWIRKKKELRIFSAKGLSAEMIKKTVLKQGEGIAGCVVDSGDPLFIPDISKDSRFKGIGNPIYSGKCLISVPLTVKDKVIGVINVNSKVKSRKFNKEDIYCLMIIATQAAIAIDNARMYREVINKLKALKVLLEISKEVASMKELSYVLQLIVEKTKEVMEVEVCSLRLLDEGGDSLTIRASVGLSEEFIKKVSRIKIGQGINGNVVKERKPIAVSNVLLDKRYTATIAAEKEGIISQLSVPIALEDKIIGTLTIYKNVEHVFMQEEINLLSTFAAESAAAIENTRLYENLNKSYFETIQTLVLTIEARDPYTRGHSDRVTQYALDIAKVLGLPESEIATIRYAGKLHDIGKIAIKDDILSKQGSLTTRERAEIRLHPDKGAQIVGPLEFMKGISAYIRGHHERFDGGGYPDGIKRGEIPLIARILSVADSYDAMTSDRPYRKKMDQDIAVGELEKNSGSQFDPEIVNAFKKALGRK